MSNPTKKTPALLPIQERDHRELIRLAEVLADQLKNREVATLSRQPLIASQAHSFSAFAALGVEAELLRLGYGQNCEMPNNVSIPRNIMQGIGLLCSALHLARRGEGEFGKKAAGKWTWTSHDFSDAVFCDMSSELKLVEEAVRQLKSKEDIAPENPYRALCDLALQVHEVEGERFDSQKGKPDGPDKWGDKFRELESNLRPLKNAGLTAADGTGFPIMEVDRRLKSLADSVLNLALWQRDAPRFTAEELVEERERYAGVVAWQPKTGPLLIQRKQAVLAAWDDVDAFAKLFEAKCQPAPTDAPAVEPEWTPADSPRRWAKIFGFSVDTLMRRFKDRTIRNKKLSSKSYQIAVSDLPAVHQSKYLPAQKSPAK